MSTPHEEGARYPRWVSAVLEWFHSTMAGLADSREARDYHTLLVAAHRLRYGSGLWVTDHAIDRFIERFGPWGDRLEAKVELFEICAGAERIGSTEKDAEVWLGHGGIRLIVRGGNVVTVLPPEEKAA